MKVQVTTSAGIVTVSALLYAFPRKGNAPVDYKLTFNGQAVETRMTGGGKYPQYVYFLGPDKVSRYLPKNVLPVSGSDIVEVKEVAKPVEVIKVTLPGEQTPVEAKVDPLQEMADGVAEEIKAAADSVPAKKRRTIKK
jgi:hypothetical protein